MEKKPLLPPQGGDGQPSAPPGAPGGLPSAPSGVAVPSPPQGGAGYRGAGYNDAGYGGAGYGNTGYNGAVTQQPYSPPFDNTTLQFKPPNYLALNMFTAFCCCLICGIMGIFVGTQVDNAWNQGNRELALKHSQNAKKLGIGGLIGGLIVHTCVIVTVGVSIGLNAQRYNYQ